MAVSLPIDINSIKGFLAADEGEALYERALQASRLGPCLEIGSYCGKSTVYLGHACRQTGSVVYALDHHRGSEEHQLGEQYHDPELYDPGVEAMAGLEDTVVPLVASSSLASRHWATPLGMVFIDGGHSEAAAQTDYRCWAGHVVRGGILAIHDIFPDPADGGQAPYHIWQLARASGLFEPLATVNTLGLLRRR